MIIVWHSVVLIANPVKMVYSDQSVLYYTFRLSKNVFLLDKFVIPSPLTIFRSNLIPPLSNLLFVCPPPQNSLSPPTHTHRKNDRSLKNHKIW